MRRLSAAVLALGLVGALAPASSATTEDRTTDSLLKDLAAHEIVVSPEGAATIREKLGLVRGLVETASARGGAPAGDTLRLLDAVDAAVVVRPGAADGPVDCVVTYVNTVLNTFQSIYYYWIHYPFYGIAAVEWGAQVMIRCIAPPN